jgi:hypothetical protein
MKDEDILLTYGLHEIVNGRESPDRRLHSTPDLKVAIEKHIEARRGSVISIFETWGCSLSLVSLTHRVSSPAGGLQMSIVGLEAICAQLVFTSSLHRRARAHIFPYA